MVREAKQIKSRTLGIDFSSVGVGYAIFDEDRLVSYGKYLQVGEKHGERLYNFGLWLEKILVTSRAEIVAIEAPYGGRGRATIVLNQYLAMILAVYFKIFHTELPPSQRIQPNAIKSRLQLVTAKDHDRNKQIMINEINKRFNLDLRWNPTDKTKKTSDDDIADAIGVVLAWLVRDQHDGRSDSRRNRNKRGTKRTKSRK